MDGRLVWGTSLEDGWRKGPWTPQEDKLLIDHVNMHGEGRWNSVAKLTGLRRSGKSCRLRWVNYLRPDLKRGKITPQEERLILELHAKWGNRWSTIARSLPGRTDNEIKNYWRTHFKKGESSKNVERAKARFLKQQQELNHQQHQLQLQLQLQLQVQREEKHQKHHNNQIEMKNVLPQVVGEAALAQEMDELLACMYPLSSYLHQGGASSFVSEPSSEDATWGSLWNLDDAGLIMRDQALNYS